MSDDRHLRLSELYLEASRLDPTERDTFITEKCTEHPSLADELRRMVGHNDDLPEILHTGSMASALDPSCTPLPQGIGPYRITELLGEGGMGVVYRATQNAPIRREVAVKLIKLGIATDKVVQRFESERQTLALMNHANIARVIDAGTTENGRSYFAMEYVGGIPITRFCDDRRLTVRERLSLFIKVCDGVQHAHHNGVIHRDIKPSNILVSIQDGEAVPKIIDFGVSKALNRGESQRTMFTEVGQFLGTPEYMSPEQTEPDSRNVDTRTDVYALGVLLYELTTGSLPLDSRKLRHSDLVEVLRRIREEDPRPPSVRVRAGWQVVELARSRKLDPAPLSKKLRGDIDWIVMKSLEKDRGRRYGSPAELAADIRRHLEHEPVLAGPPSVVNSTRKFLRKHRIAAAFVSVLAISAAALTAVMAVQTDRVADERQRAAQEAETAATLSSYLEDLFDVGARTDLRGIQMDPVRIFDQGTERIATLEGQPFLHATLLRLFGALQSAVGRHEKAIPLLETASRQLESLRGSEDPGTLTAEHYLAVAYSRSGRFGEALALFERVSTARVRLLGADHPSSLSTQLQQGLAYKFAKRNAEAERVLASAFDGMRRTHGPRSPITLTCASFLGSIYLEQRRHYEVEALLSSVVGLMLEVLGEDHIEYRATQYNLAAAILARGDKNGALALLEQVPGGVPTDPRRDPHFKGLWQDPRLYAIGKRAQLAQPEARFIEELGIMQSWKLETLNEAEKRSSDLVHANQANLGPEHPETERATQNLAGIYSWQGRCDKARPLLANLLEQQRSRLGPGTIEESDTLWWLAQCEIADDRIDEAQALLARRRTIRLRLEGPHSPAYLETAAESTALNGDLEGALEFARSADVDEAVVYNQAFKQYVNDSRLQAFLVEFGVQPASGARAVSQRR